ncbi:MAG: IS91 family transposase [Sulfurimicrobium sp.]|nr:IS91 family transposase [Sulfurimicrobium sp.]
MVTLDEIFRRYGPAYLDQFGENMLGSHKRAIEAICSCLTPKLGGHVYQCEDCGAEHVILHSCRNRACPRCQAQARDDWLDARAKEILPVRCFHAVFTVPHELAMIIRSNQKDLLSLLMRSSAEAVQKLALDKKFLGGQVGILAVLHTWGSTLEYHPHVHCLIPGGAIAEKGTVWRESRQKFLVAVRPLSKLFRGIFLSGLKELMPEYEIPAAVREKDWNVFIKPAMQGPEALLKYLGRYVHRIAISNGRLISLEDGNVTFVYKDYRDGRKKRMTLPVFEFMRRFLQHVLPSGFHKVRYYGFLSPGSRKKLLRVRMFLYQSSKYPVPATEEKKKSILACKNCGSVKLRLTEVRFPSKRSPPQ